MSSDNDLSFAALDLFSCQPLFLRRHGTCQQNGTKWDVMDLQQFLHRLVMLLCQHFCGYHQSSLISIAACHDQCQYCKDRLAGSHISLHQTAHNFCSGHIRYNFPPDSHLCIRQFIRKSLDQPGCLADFHHRHLVDQFFLLFFHPTDSQYKQKELIKHDPLSRLSHHLLIGWKMHLPHSIPLRLQIIFSSHVFRQIFRHINLSSINDLMNRLHHHFFRQARSQWISWLHHIE